MTFLISGTCTLAADQAGNTVYAAAPQVSHSITVAGTPQTISFVQPVQQTVGTPLTLGATAGSSLAVVYSSSTTTVCTVSGSTVTFLISGTCTLTADQAGNSVYAAAPQVSHSVTVAGTPQTITFAQPAQQTVGTPLTLGATAGSSLAVVYSSSTTTVCTVSGSTVTFLISGTCTLTADQAGNTVYAAAPQVSQSVTVAGTPQTITFANPGTQNFGTPLTVTATGGPSGNEVTFISATTGVCTVTSGGTVTFVTPGTCTLIADQLGSNRYAAAAPVIQTFIVAAVVPGAPAITTISAGNTRVTIAFTAPGFTGGAVITGYTAACGSVTATGTASPITVTGVTNGRAYTCTVTAGNTSGSGAASEPSNSVTPKLSAGPLKLNISSFPTGMVGSEYPLQVMTATGGVKPYTFSISAGSLPAGLSFSNPEIAGIPTSAGTTVFTLSVKDGGGGEASAPVTILINPANADLILSGSTVLFDLISGASVVPAPASITVRSSVIQQLLNYTVQVSPAVGWLSVTGGGATPGGITVGLSSAVLGAAATGGGDLLSQGAYQTTVTATCIAPSPCAGSVKTVTVSLNVTAPAPVIALTSGVLAFHSVEASAGAQVGQSVGVRNTGGGTITISSATASASWISVGSLPGSLRAGPAVPLNVTVNPAGLGSGFYSGTVVFATSAGSVTLPVTLAVAPKPVILLAPGGAQYQMTVNGSPGNPNGTFRISLPNYQSTIRWNASVLPGASWLTLNTSEGTANAGVPGVVSYAVDPSGLTGTTAQTYYGAIRVTSADVVNSPVDYQVVLNVMAAAIPVKPEPSPAGLVFVPAAGVTKSIQTVQVFAASTNPLAYQASIATEDGAGWLSVSPATGFTSSSAPGQAAVSVNTTGLAAGVYRGSVSFAYASAGVRTVSVTLLVVAGAPAAGSTLTSRSSQGASQGATQRATTAAGPAGCTPTKLIGTQVGLVNNFQQLMGWPLEVAVSVMDDCGTAVSDAQVVTSFSNEDPPLKLYAIDNISGKYSGTWIPRAASPQVSILATATGLNGLGGTVQITGQVSSNTPPLLAANGVLHVFVPAIGGGLAPGTVLQLYGSNLGSEPVAAGKTPLPVGLGGTSVQIGGVAAPLYYVAPGQINAQLPYELKAGNQYEVQVNVNGALSSPVPISVVPVSPGIAAYGSGGVIAQHADYSLISAAAPAKPGEVIILYLAGMGAVDAEVATGAASPATPLAHPVQPPVLTVNGNPVPTVFAGLVPGAVGLYQVNFKVPEGLSSGTAKLVVSQAGTESNSVSLPVGK